MTTPAAPEQRGHGFGTAPVFLAAICTILGAILLLRFGYAVGQVGMLGALAIIPIQRLNRLVASGRGKANEPFVATLVTSVFFKVTYGALCATSFLRHFAGNPSYRPTFRSKWYLSLLGAVGCAVMMWQMQPLYAVVAAVVMVGLYFWIRPGDSRNASLMILLGYILIGHPQWKGAEMKLFAAFHEKEMARGVARLNGLINRGRIPISVKNVSWGPIPVGASFDEMVNQRSKGADLVITGLSMSKMEADGGQFLDGFEAISDILFVRAGQQILITSEDEVQPDPEPSPADTAGTR
jgi:hypothetical protein